MQTCETYVQRTTPKAEYHFLPDAASLIGSGMLELDKVDSAWSKTLLPHPAITHVRYIRYITHGKYVHNIDNNLDIKGTGIIRHDDHLLVVLPSLRHSRRTSLVKGCLATYLHVFKH